MTVNATTSKASFSTNGSVNQFTFSFPGVSAGDIQLWVTNAAGVITQIPSMQYQVVLNTPISPNPTSIGGQVNYPIPPTAPLPTGNTVTIIRSLPQVQATSLANQSTLYPVAIEQALDYLTMVDQQTSEVEGRAITVALSDPAPPSLPPAVQRANQAFVFDAFGNPTVGVIPGGATVSPAMAPVVSASTLASARAQMGVPGYLTAKSFGAIGNGTADDTVALQAWIRALQTQALPGWIEPGNYKISSALLADQAGPLVIQGPGNGGHGFANIQLSNTTQDGIAVTNHNGIVVIRDLQITALGTQTAGAGIHFPTASVQALYPMFQNLIMSNMFNGIIAADASTPTGQSGALLFYFIDHCTIVASNICVQAQSASDCQIRGCLFQPQGLSAIGVFAGGDPAGLKFIGNKMISSSCQAGLYFAPQISDGLLIIAGNSIELTGSATNAILVTAAATGLNFDNITITGNEFLNSGTAVNISLGSGTAITLSRISISGNVFWNGGISLTGGLYFSINGNAFQSTNTLGDVIIDATSAKGIVIGNAISRAINSSASPTSVLVPSGMNAGP